MRQEISGFFWENERVRIQNFLEEDGDVIAEAMKDSTFRMQAEHGIALPTSAYDAADFIERANACLVEGESIWLSVCNLRGDIVGYCGLSWIDERAGNLELSVTIFPKEQRKGYGRAACEILLAYAFLERRIHKVNACVLGKNQAGKAFACAMGFLVEAERTDMFYTHGRYDSEIYLGLLEREYLGEKTEQFELDRRLAVRRGDGVLPADALANDSELCKLGKARRTATDSTDNMRLCKLVDAEQLLYDHKYYWAYEDIILREMTEEDYMKNHEILLDSMSCRFYDCDVSLPVFSEEPTERDKEHLRFEGEDGRLEFAVTDQAGNYVGNVNLCGLDQKNGKFSLSIYMIPEVRGRGYGTKALKRILSYAFLELRMHKFITIVNDGNIASETMMKHVGCQVEGIHRENIYYMGRYVDEIFLGVTKEEFLQAL